MQSVSFYNKLGIMWPFKTCYQNLICISVIEWILRNHDWSLSSKQKQKPWINVNKNLTQWGFNKIAKPKVAGTQESPMYINVHKILDRPLKYSHANLKLPGNSWYLYNTKKTHDSLHSKPHSNTQELVRIQTVSPSN